MANPSAMVDPSTSLVDLSTSLVDPSTSLVDPSTSLVEEHDKPRDFVLALPYDRALTSLVTNRTVRSSFPSTCCVGERHAPHNLEPVPDRPGERRSNLSR
eukprot:gene26473-17564_t